MWDAEAANTQPNALIWDRHRSGIIAVQGGLYEVKFGFFSAAKPQVTLLLNDEPVLASKGAKGPDKQTSAFEHMHTSGNVTGLTCVEYLILPPKARLSFRLKGNSPQEGFFLIKKI